jgi:hypothetical protein
LENSFSTGPFSYQHQHLTGSAPLIRSTIEEPQTQISYRLKVDYAHMALMLDPNFFLLPEEKYNWTKDSLHHNDARLNEKYFLELGVAYGYFSIHGIFNSNPLGVYIDDEANLTHQGFYKSFSANLKPFLLY